MPHGGIAFWVSLLIMNLGLDGGVVALIQWAANRRRARADTSGIYTEQAERLLDMADSLTQRAHKEEERQAIAAAKLRNDYERLLERSQAQSEQITAQSEQIKAQSEQIRAQSEQIKSLTAHVAMLEEQMSKVGIDVSAMRTAVERESPPNFPDQR